MATPIKSAVRPSLGFPQREILTWINLARVQSCSAGARGPVSDAVACLRAARLRPRSRPGWLRQRRVAGASPAIQWLILDERLQARRLRYKGRRDANETLHLRRDARIHKPFVLSPSNWPAISCLNLLLQPGQPRIDERARGPCCQQYRRSCRQAQAAPRDKRRHRARDERGKKALLETLQRRGQTAIAGKQVEQ